MKEAIKYLKAQLAHNEQRQVELSDELTAKVSEYDEILTKLENEAESFNAALRVLEAQEPVTIHPAMTCDPDLSHGRGRQV